ncbi:MAG: sulfotransferase domain-containing protein [Leptolyngbya sp. SIO3F4]|nr:sulfotransferase domain-containing protein [Leptolyngbya sp. SIO3F4]
MIIISAGFMKSASTLIHDYQIEIINLVARRNGQKMLEKFSSGRGAAYRGKLDLKTFVLLVIINFIFGDIALKTHSGPTFFVRLLVSLGLAKVTYSYRDPRDVALSMLDHGNRTRQKEGENFKDNRGFSDVFKVEDAIPKVRQEIDNWYGWRDFKDVHLVRYEDFMNNKEDVLKQMISYLGYEMNALDFDKLLEKYQTVKSRNFNKGTSGRYKVDMSPDDLELYNITFSEELSDMEYAS